MALSRALTRFARCACAITLVLASLGLPAGAQDNETGFGGGFAAERPYLWSPQVDDDILKDVRGGVLLSSGYMVDFAIEMTTMVDGVTEARSVISSDVVNSLANSAAGSVIQLGDGNTISPEVYDQITNYVTVVQNTKPDTLIQQLIDGEITIQGYDPVSRALFRDVIDQNAGP